MRELNQLQYKRSLEPKVSIVHQVALFSTICHCCEKDSFKNHIFCITLKTEYEEEYRFIYLCETCYRLLCLCDPIFSCVGIGPPHGKTCFEKLKMMISRKKL